jgi:hypothetical protein
MAPIGWTTFRLPKEELEKVRSLSVKYDLSLARMMLELVRIGIKHIKEIGLRATKTTITDLRKKKEE